MVPSLTPLRPPLPPKWCSAMSPLYLSKYFGPCLQRRWRSSLRNLKSFEVYCKEARNISVVYYFHHENTHCCWTYGATVSESTPSGIKPAKSSPTAVVVHAAAAHPAVPSVSNRPSLIPCSGLHFLEHSARRRAVCTVCLFLPATARDILVSPVISGHHSLNSVLRYRGICNSLGCFSHAKSSWLSLTNVTDLLLPSYIVGNKRLSFPSFRPTRTFYMLISAYVEDGVADPITQHQQQEHHH